MKIIREKRCIERKTRTRSKLSFALSQRGWGFPHSSVDTESACNAGDLGSIPGTGRSPGEGNGSPLQYSCLENPMDRGAWQATIHGVARVGHDLATRPPPPPQGVGGRSQGQCWILSAAVCDNTCKVFPTGKLTQVLVSMVFISHQHVASAWLTWASQSAASQMSNWHRVSQSLGTKKQAFTIKHVVSTNYFAWPEGFLYKRHSYQAEYFKGLDVSQEGDQGLVLKMLELCRVWVAQGC